MKVLVNKGTLLSEVRPLLLFAIVSQTSRECVSRECQGSECQGSVGGGRDVSLVEVRVWCKKV